MYETVIWCHQPLVHECMNHPVLYFKMYYLPHHDINQKEYIFICSEVSFCWRSYVFPRRLQTGALPKWEYFDTLLKWKSIQGEKKRRTVMATFIQSTFNDISLERDQSLWLSADDSRLEDRLRLLSEFPQCRFRHQGRNSVDLKTAWKSACTSQQKVTTKYLEITDFFLNLL